MISLNDFDTFDMYANRGCMIAHARLCVTSDFRDLFLELRDAATKTYRPLTHIITENNIAVL